MHVYELRKYSNKVEVYFVSRPEELLLRPICKLNRIMSAEMVQITGGHLTLRSMLLLLQSAHHFSLKTLCTVLFIILIFRTSWRRCSEFKWSAPRRSTSIYYARSDRARLRLPARCAAASRAPQHNGALRAPRPRARRASQMASRNVRPFSSHTARHNWCSCCVHFVGLLAGPHAV